MKLYLFLLPHKVNSTISEVNESSHTTYRQADRYVTQILTGKRDYNMVYKTSDEHWIHTN